MSAARSLYLLPTVICLLIAPGCATFRPTPFEEIPFPARVQTKEEGGVTVTVSVPTRKEGKKAFGVDIEKKKIQPVWIKIDNTSSGRFWFMLNSLDPNYYSAREVAYISHFRFGGSANKEMDKYFEDHAINQEIYPYSSTEGFAFSNLKLGTKGVRIRLFGEQQVRDFEFYVSVPGLRADWQRVDSDTMYTEDEIVDCESEEELKEALIQLPLTTTRKSGSGRGDPLNLIIISNSLEPFIKAGWDETEILSAGSVWRTIKAFFGGEYKHSPMSKLYVFGRSQDVSLQKARDSIHERNHLRLWATPIHFRGKTVWVGTITRDIGVYFTTRAWNMMTHAIDPNIDEAMNYLAEDLATTQTVNVYTYLKYLESRTRENPYRNLMNAPYWTDGRRAILLLSEDVVPLEGIKYLEWE